MADRSEIDRVRDATNLVELIGGYVTLQPKGREHVGLCPFHDDHSPSMAVVTHKAQSFYKCFSCGASGDAFTFLEKYLKMDFREALELLAERASITLTRTSPSPDDARQREQRDLVRRANDRALDFFKQTLTSSTGAQARAMIQSRGISDEMVESFQIGCAPEGWDGLLRSLPDNAKAHAAFMGAGLLKERSEGNGFYDSFRNRLIFPIFNQAGQAVGFGGRIIDPADEPKYLNSPETELFQKGRTLYGLHLARKSIGDTGRAIVTEGYTDVIACHQAGHCNVVGTLGTALTDDHARILSRLCDTIVLLFDGDDAGQRAADRALEVVLKHPVDVRICILPAGADPADLLSQEDGADHFEQVVANSTDVLEYVLQRFEQVLQTQEGLSGRQNMIERFLGELQRLGLASVHGVRRSLLLCKLAELLAMPLATVETMLTSLGQAPGSSRQVPTTEPKPDAMTLLPDPDAPLVPGHRRTAEEHYLAILVHEPGVHAGTGLLEVDAFIVDRHRSLARILLPILAGGGTPPMQELLSELPDTQLGEFASHLWFIGERLLEEAGQGERPFQEATDALRTSIEHEKTDALKASWGADPTNDATEAVARIKLIRGRGGRPSAIHRETGR